MKTPEPRKINERGFLTLPDFFIDRGWHYNKIERDGLVAIYSKTKPEFRKDFESYEVFLIKENASFVLGEMTVPAKENMPSSEQWGLYGFTCLTLDQARIKMEHLKTLKKKEEKA